MKTPQIRTNDIKNLTSEEIVETLLVESGTATRFPTDEHKLLSFLGLKQLSFDFKEELDFPEIDPRSRKDLRAVLSRKERIVAVDSDLKENRSRFSVLHEVGHFILPEHHDRLFFPDYDETLSWWTRVRLEREANQIAADLLFQGRRFTDESIDHPIAFRTILDLAPRFGASYEATARRYAERHILPCAVLIYDKISKTNEIDFDEDTYRLQYTVASGPFRKQFFRGLDCTPNRFTASELYKPKYWGEVTQGELIVEQDSSSSWRFETESFSNNYKIFQLVKSAKKLC